MCSQDGRLSADELEDVDYVRDVIAQALKRRDERFARLYAGRSKGYLDGTSGLHIHLGVRSGHCGIPGGEFCVLVERSAEPDCGEMNIEVLQPIDAQREIAQGDAGEGERPMLVHVVEFAEDPQRMVERVVRSVVRLQALDECEHFRGDLAAGSRDVDLAASAVRTNQRIE